MKRILLSTVAILSLGAVNALANQFYVDQNGQVFAKAGEGRVALKSSTPVFAKADKLKFSGTAFLGYVYTSQEDTTINNESQFEIRRAYLQLKAYLLDDPKSYYRVTLDAHSDGGSQDIRMKYAYLYLNNILPSTGVEFGLAHRPWHDYEEHNSWGYRSIQKVFLENKNGADLSNSADFGVNFKTKTKFFDSEIGVFNGEGYHKDFQGNDASITRGNIPTFLGLNIGLDPIVVPGSYLEY
jgi:hypothetical protein